MKKIACLLALTMLCAGLPVKTVKADGGAEVFDIREGGVVQMLVDSAALQEEAALWLSAISGPAGGLGFEPKEGIGVKIVLAPPRQVNTRWIQGTVTEAVLFVSPSPAYPPTVLLLTKENRMAAVHVKHNLKPFLVKHGLYKPEYNLTAPPPAAAAAWYRTILYHSGKDTISFPSP
ncbi:hypothetical protein MJA45_24295 [Paenibacillus aurantius]|uniref:Uncharacterized protein n=1 Tax=Paenibacillus aurantius TaxID=2918900 RepID=A0AA96RES5_9BACL|nr:hypothetical protein [Paenibacillus aurantius]WNQ10706.1 hypothetical protein MJA45_24295 [Paenibacillus aurantius]